MALLYQSDQCDILGVNELCSKKSDNDWPKLLGLSRLRVIIPWAIIPC